MIGFDAVDPGGGGGYFHMYAYWVCAARETPIFSPEFPFRSISFSQITKKSVPEHHHFPFFGGFCRSLISTRSSPPTAGSARTQNVRQCRGLAAVPEIRIFTLKTAQARSGASHFHARRELVPEPLPIFHFAAAHTYQNLG